MGGRGEEGGKRGKPPEEREAKEKELGSRGRVRDLMIKRDIANIERGGICKGKNIRSAVNKERKMQRRG